MSDPRLLIKKAEVLATMDHVRREIRDGAVMVCGGVIGAVGTDAEIKSWIAADPARKPQRTIAARGCVIMPGLVNCHHHLYQSLTRTIGTRQGLGLFDWLKLLYPVWAELDPEAVYVSAWVGLAELVLSGATTVRGRWWCRGFRTASPAFNRTPSHGVTENPRAARDHRSPLDSCRARCGARP